MVQVLQLSQNLCVSRLYVSVSVFASCSFLAELTDTNTVLTVSQVHRSAVQYKPLQYMPLHTNVCFKRSTAVAALLLYITYYAQAYLTDIAT